MPNTIYHGRDTDGNYVDETSYHQLAQQNTLVDLNITYVNLSTGETTYQVRPNLGIVVGADNLIQRIVKSILTVKESSAYEPSFGSYFAEIYSALGAAEIEDIKSKFPLYLSNVTDTLIEADAVLIAQGTIIPPEERLQNLTLETVEYDETFNGWLMTIKIQTAANISFVVNLP